MLHHKWLSFLQETWVSRKNSKSKLYHIHSCVFDWHFWPWSPILTEFVISSDKEPILLVHSSQTRPILNQQYSPLPPPIKQQPAKWRCICFHTPEGGVCACLLISVCLFMCTDNKETQRQPVIVQGHSSQKMSLPLVSQYWTLILPE